MPENENRAEQRYTLMEIKAKYFPNRDLESLQKSASVMPRDEFTEMLEQVGRSLSKPRPTSTDTTDTTP